VKRRGETTVEVAHYVVLFVVKLSRDAIAIDIVRRILICNISRDSILMLIDSSANIELSFFIKMNEVPSLKYLKNLIKIMMIHYRNSRKSIHRTEMFYI